MAGDPVVGERVRRRGVCRRLLVALLVLSAAACTGGDDGPAGGRLSSSGIGAVESSVADEVQEELDADADLAAAVERYQRFVADRDAALMGDGDALDRARSVGSVFVVDDLLADVDQYRQMRESAGLEVAVSTASSIGQATLTENGSVRIRDCLEVRQVEESGVVDPVQLVWQESRMALVEGEWVVDRFVTRHDGQGSSSERYGCVPQRHQDRLIDTAMSLMSMVVEVERDAELEWPEELDEVASAEFATSLRDEVGAPTRDREVTSPLGMRVVGVVSDAQSKGYGWEVAFCLRYPEGRQWTWLDDGEVVVEEPFEALSEVAVTASLVSEVDGDSYRDRVVGMSEPVVRSCWDSGGDDVERIWS